MLGRGVDGMGWAECLIVECLVAGLPADKYASGLGWAEGSVDEKLV